MNPNLQIYGRAKNRTWVSASYLCAVMFSLQLFKTDPFVLSSKMCNEELTQVHWSQWRNSVAFGSLAIYFKWYASFINWWFIATKTAYIHAIARYSWEGGSNRVHTAEFLFYLVALLLRRPLYMEELVNHSRGNFSRPKPVLCCHVCAVPTAWLQACAGQCKSLGCRITCKCPLCVTVEMMNNILFL